MNKIVLLGAAVLFLAGSVAGAQAANVMMSSDAGKTLPSICTSTPSGAASTGSMGSMGGMGNMDKAHEALMAGMDQMQEHMSQGMAAKNIDVAFICGMIPHHQGAIDMAKAELQYGKDPFARKLAEGIIAAQEKEIAEMLDWLKKQPK